MARNPNPNPNPNQAKTKSGGSYQQQLAELHLDWDRRIAERDGPNARDEDAMVARARKLAERAAASEMGPAASLLMRPFAVRTITLTLTPAPTLPLTIAGR